MMKNKAQGMSLNVIIIAVIVLIVLVVLVLVFSGKIKLFGSQTTSTASQYSGDKCLIPGTNNECAFSGDTSCTAKGGSYSDNGGRGYTDCSGSGCCLM